MSVTENKDLIRRRIEEFNAFGGDAGKIRAWCEKDYASDVTYHLLGDDLNREEAIKALEAPGFSGQKWVIDDIVAERDKVVVSLTCHANHTGTFMGIPATGKHIAMKDVGICRISEGKTVEVWEFPDMLGMMTQLGAIPTPRE